MRGTAAVLALAASATAELNFLQQNDVIGMKSTFVEGTGLPVDEYTISGMYYRDTRDRSFTFGCDWELTEVYDNLLGLTDIMMDYKSHTFETLKYWIEKTGKSEDELLMNWHLWTFTYNRSDTICQYIDDILLECIATNNPWEGKPIFGPDSVPTLTIGQYGAYTGGVYTQLMAKDQFRGRAKLFQMYNYKMTDAQVAALYAGRDSITGSETGLNIFYKMDEGSGDVLTNLGSAGSKYDGILGAYATAEDTTTDVFGNAMTDCVPVTATKPVWPSSGGVNHKPVVTNQTTQVVEDTSSTTTSVGFFLYSSDEDGDMLKYTVTSLPSHGVLNLVSGDETESYPITTVPFDTWTVYNRSSFEFFPGQGELDTAVIRVAAWDGTEQGNSATMTISIMEVDDVPEAHARSLVIWNTTEDTSVEIELAATDPDTEYLTIVVSELPTQGKLYKKNADGTKGDEILQYSEWEVPTPLEQYVKAVSDADGDGYSVSTFWPASLADNGYPKWHPEQIIGEQTVDFYGDSVYAFCPSSTMGTTNAVQEGGDHILFKFNTWASYLANGYTEYIEIEYETEVYPQSLMVGENRGMGSITNVLAWDDGNSRWMTMYSERATKEIEDYHKKINMYHYFTPTLCEPPFKTKRLRLELNSYEVEDWNELDFARLLGSPSIKQGVLQASLADQSAFVIYEPFPDANGVDTFKFGACDCAYFAARCSKDATVTISVDPVNDAPVTPDTTFPLTCNGTDTVTLTASDVDVGDSLTYTIQSLPVTPGAKLLADGTEITSVPFELSGTAVTLNLADMLASGADMPESFGFTYTAKDALGALSAPGVAALTCSAFSCPPGEWYNGVTGACVPCPAGTAESEAGMRSMCTPCPKGQYGPAAGLTQCIDCVYGTVAYRPGTVACLDCPFGAKCPEQKAVDIDKGFWRTSYDSFEVLECPRALSCTGGNGTEDSCKEGSEGVLCNTCSENWFNGISGECVECSGSEAAQVFGVIGVFSLGFIGFIYWIFQKAYRDPSAKDMVRRWNTNVKNATPTLKLILITYQIICAIEWELEIKFPEPFRTFQAIFGMLRLSLGQDSRILPIGCMFDTDFLDTLLISTLGPLFGVLFIYVACMVFHRSTPEDDGDTIMKLSKLLMILLMFCVLPSTSTQIFRTFHCREFDDPVAPHLFADLSVECYTPRHNSFVMYAALMIFVYPIGIPAMYYYLLFSNKDIIRPATSAATANSARSSFREEDRTIWHLGFLFRYYKPEYMYFEVFESVRRIVMACLLGFVGNSSARATVGLALVGCSIIINREVMPFMNPNHNFMAVWSQWQIGITLFLSLLLVSMPFGFTRLGVGIALTVVNCGLLILTYLHHSGWLDQMRETSSFYKLIYAPKDKKYAPASASPSKISPDAESDS